MNFSPEGYYINICVVFSYGGVSTCVILLLFVMTIIKFNTVALSSRIAIKRYKYSVATPVHTWIKKHHTSSLQRGLDLCDINEVHFFFFFADSEPWIFFGLDPKFWWRTVKPTARASGLKKWTKNHPKNASRAVAIIAWHRVVLARQR